MAGAPTVIARVAIRSGSVMRSSPGSGPAASRAVVPHPSCQRLASTMPAAAAAPMAATRTTFRRLIRFPALVGPACHLDTPPRSAALLLAAIFSRDAGLFPDSTGNAGPVGGCVSTNAGQERSARAVGSAAAATKQQTFPAFRANLPAHVNHRRKVTAGHQLAELAARPDAGNIRLPADAIAALDHSPGHRWRPAAGGLTPKAARPGDPVRPGPAAPAAPGRRR